MPFTFFDRPYTLNVFLQLNSTRVGGFFIFYLSCSISAHAGLGGGGVIKMRANVCMGEGGSGPCVRTAHGLSSQYGGPNEQIVLD